MSIMRMRAQRLMPRVSIGGTTRLLVPTAVRCLASLQRPAAFNASKPRVATVGLTRRAFASGGGAGAAAVTESVVRDKLSELKPDVLHVTDTSGGCGTFFRVLIVSSLFDGKSLVASHRIVNDRLRAELPLIHGMQLTCKTPKQWAELQKQHAAAAPAE